MILTCPSCDTQYVVKDGSIPPQGRQVRCAACKHSWHQDPESGGNEDETIAEAAIIQPRSGPEAEERAYQAAALAGAGDGFSEPPDAGEHDAVTAAATPAGYEPIDPVAPPADGLVEAAPAAPPPPLETEDRDMADESLGGRHEPSADDDFSPFAMREADERRGRGPLLTVLMIALLIAAAAAAFWFLAPAEWKQRVGITGAGDTPLQLMMTHSDRQKLASGNELLAISGRVINPTDKSQDVPPIRAQLRSSSGKLVYSWTIAPPARILPPGASATFNSAEVNVPAGGEELTITLGPVRT